MIFVADIGNTNIVVAIYNGEEWVHKYRFETKVERPGVYYEAGLRDLLFEWQISPADISTVVLSSVVPHLNATLIDAIKTNFRKEPIVLGPELFLKLDMVVPKVYEIGADLVANGYAAMKIYAKNTIIVDFGTALTFTVYEHGKGITGVTIAPGLHTIISTLSGNTALLPTVDISLPPTAIGTSTNTAIRAGVLFGYIGLVKEILNRIKSELSAEYYVVATGGLSTSINELQELYDDVDKNLTLDGIRLLAGEAL